MLNSVYINPKVAGFSELSLINGMLMFKWNFVCGGMYLEVAFQSHVVLHVHSPVSAHVHMCRLPSDKMNAYSWHTVLNWNSYIFL